MPRKKPPTAGRVKLPKPTPLRTPSRKRNANAGPHQPHWTTDYTEDEVEWLAAVEAWKKRTGCQFPALRDLLGIAKGLGYRKGGTKGGTKGDKADD